MTKRAITKENSSEIGFVSACLLSNAISIEELNEWAISIAATENDYPLYIVELFDFNAPLMHLTRTIGFAPVSGLSSNQSEALSAIAPLRGRRYTNESISHESAKQLLANEPNVIQRFVLSFPQLELKTNVV